MSEMSSSDDMSADEYCRMSSDEYCRTSSDDESDDESSISIGEISIDDYYDERCYDDRLLENVKIHVPKESNNGANHELMVTNNEANDTLRTLRPQIITTSENLLQQVPPRVTLNTRNTRKIKRKAAIKARVAIVKSIPKRRTQRVVAEEKRRIRIIESGGEPNERKPKPLKAYGIITNSFFDGIYFKHDELIRNYNFLTCVPAKNTVEDILTRYTIKKNANWEALDYFLKSFDGALPLWVLMVIERIQYENVVKKYPNLPMSRIYGLPHLVRFIVYLPLLFLKMSIYGPEYANKMSEFTSGFMTYMIEEKMTLDVNNCYENVMPEYYRMTYPNRIRRLAPPRSY